MTVSTVPTPRAAVVIPCYNDGRFLTEAIGSLRHEEPHDLVVVDDGSTDGETLAILEDLARAGTRIVRQENRGLGAARMAGVRVTEARYVLTLDADDRLVPGALSTLADALDAHPGAQVAWGDIRMFGARECLQPQAPRLDPWRITYLNELPASGGSMFKREALHATGGWELSGGYEDWDLWMKFAEEGFDGVHLPVETFLYRIHPNPRLLRTAEERHAELCAILRTRHSQLFAGRRLSKRRSPSPLLVKILFPAVEMCPGLSPTSKHQLFLLIRSVVEKRMASDDSPSLRTLLRRVTGSRIRNLRRSLGSPRSARRPSSSSRPPERGAGTG